MPGEIESKKLHYGGNDNLAKGSQRYEKHARQGESDQTKFAEAGPGVDQNAPGLEGLSGEEAMGRVEGKENSK